jgi:Asp/Glu/hydantoin racemase
MAILVVNPNSTRAMTKGVEDAIRPLSYGVGVLDDILRGV